MIKLDSLSFTKNFISLFDIKKYSNKVEEIKSKLYKKESMLDWFDTSSTISKDELKDIKTYSEYIRNNCDVFIVIGIGGSYLGSKAIIDCLSPYFKKTSPQIIYAGTSLSSEYIDELINYIKDKNICINIISKSGTTLETTIASNIFLNIIKTKHPKDYKNRVFITTNKESGSLRQLCNKENFKSLNIPNNIGGRFSVFTTVGLLPICVAGIDINKLLDGYNNGKKYLDSAIEYGIDRDILLNKKYYVEALTTYEPKLLSFSYWIQQLFAESLGKNKNGVLPLPNPNTTNLHSIGQYLQDGTNIVFETVLKIKDQKIIKLDKYNTTLNKLQDVVISQVALAHLNGATPSILIEIEDISEKSIGELVFFYFISATTCGYLQNINPFDQPGVEEYKKLVNQKINKPN